MITNEQMLNAAKRRLLKHLQGGRPAEKNIAAYIWTQSRAVQEISDSILEMEKSPEWSASHEVMALRAERDRRQAHVRALETALSDPDKVYDETTRCLEACVAYYSALCEGVR